MTNRRGDKKMELVLIGGAIVVTVVMIVGYVGLFAARNEILAYRRRRAQYQAWKKN